MNAEKIREVLALLDGVIGAGYLDDYCVREAVKILTAELNASQSFTPVDTDAMEWAARNGFESA